MSTPLEVNRLLGSLEAQSGGLDGTHNDAEKTYRDSGTPDLQPDISGLHWLFNIIDLE